MKLIDADRAKYFSDIYFGDPILNMAVKAVLDSTPALELVHCSECVKGDTRGCRAGEVWCHKLCVYMKESGFCSFGKESEGE